MDVFFLLAQTRQKEKYIACVWLESTNNKKMGYSPFEEMTETKIQKTKK